MQPFDVNTTNFKFKASRSLTAEGFVHALNTGNHNCGRGPLDHRPVLIECSAISIWFPCHLSSLPRLPSDCIRHPPLITCLPAYLSHHELIFVPLDFLEPLRFQSFQPISYFHWLWDNGRAKPSLVTHETETFLMNNKTTQKPMSPKRDDKTMPIKLVSKRCTKRDKIRRSHKCSMPWSKLRFPLLEKILSHF